MSHTICYVSKAAPGLSNEDVEAIFTYTLENNNARGIKGILVFGFGNFFQVIEGDRRTIVRLFRSIQKDERHQKIEVLINNRMSKPVFGSYSASFNIVKTKTQLADISNYLNVIKYNRIFSERMKRLIHPFLLSL